MTLSLLLELESTNKYIPKISNETYIPKRFRQRINNLQNRTIHEGRVSPKNYLSKASFNLFYASGFQQIYHLNEKVCPRFVLEFYSSVKIIRDKDSNIFVKF